MDRAELKARFLAGSTSLLHSNNASSFSGTRRIMLRKISGNLAASNLSWSRHQVYELSLRWHTEVDWQACYRH